MKRIAVIHPEGNFNNNPNLRGILIALANLGYHIDIYAGKHDIDQSSPHKLISPYLLSQQHTFMYDAAVLLPSITHMSPLDAAKVIAPQLNNPDIVIGIDRGVIEAHAIADALGIPYGLISYEIYFADETSREFKIPEIIACANLSFAVCQDRARASELCRENEINPDKIIYLPVAPAGVVKRNRNSLIHKALGIPNDKKLMLYMGEIGCAWAGIFDILENVPSWPDDWALVLHHRYGKGGLSEIENIIDSTPKKNIHVSPFPSLPSGRMHELLDSVDAGLAFYMPNNDHALSNKNLKYIGLASGKISTYLQHGLPVVTNEIGEISQLLRNFEAGLSVQNGLHLANCLKSFRARDIAINANCHRLFSEVLDLNKTIVPLLFKIGELVNSKLINKTRVGTDSEIMLTKSWLGNNPDSGSLIKTFQGASRSLSIWSIRGLKVLSENGLIVTPDGTLLEESTTEYNTVESLKDLKEKNFTAPSGVMKGDFMSLSGYWSEGFYHWMLEWLPRAYLAEISGFKGKYILSKSNAFILSSLNMLGISEDRIVITPLESWIPETLWIVETCHAGEYENFPEILLGMREKILKDISIDNTQKPKRLFISRTNPNRPRRIVNETELMQMLVKFGFEWVDLDGMPLKNQLEIVSGADAIVSPHGAGIVHSLFIRERSLVLEIFSPNYVNPCCLAIQSALNHRYHPLVSLNTDGNYKHGDNIHAPIRLIELSLQHELSGK